MSKEPEGEKATPPLLESTEFRLEEDTGVMIATHPGLVGRNIAEGATIKLARQDDVGDSTAGREAEYRVLSSRYRLETYANASVSHSVQEILIQRIHKPWYTRLSGGWQTAIGFAIAIILLLPFMYQFFMIPVVSSVISAQLESRDLVVLDDENHSITPRTAAGAAKTLDPYETSKTEQETLYKGFLGKRVVPVVPWILFIILGIVLPFLLAKRLGGKYHKDNQVLRSFFTLVGMAIGFAAVHYWFVLATPAKPLTVWPQDFANHFDYLRQRIETFWPIVAAWVVPLGVALLKLVGLDGFGQLVEKLVGSKK